MALLTSGPSSSLFLWSSLGVVVLKIPINATAPVGDPGDLSPHRVRWNPQGRAMCLVGKDSFICAKLAAKKKVSEKGE